MPKDYLNYLTLESKKFAKKNDVFDIILYGSFVKGKDEARDIDILVIFKQKNLKERTDLVQDFKEILTKKINNIDLKTINLRELFEKEFLARQSILVEGYSLLSDMALAEKIGFKGYALFTYNLQKLNHNEKTKFTYALIGRNSEGIVKQLGGISLGRGALIIPIGNGLVFENFLLKWGVSFNKKAILISEL